MGVNILPLGLVKLLLEMYPDNTIEQVEKDILSRIFTEALFIFFKNKQTFGCPSGGDYSNK